MTLGSLGFTKSSAAVEDRAPEPALPVRLCVKPHFRLQSPIDEAGYLSDTRTSHFAPAMLHCKIMIRKS